MTNPNSIDVVVPVYNGGVYLRECLQSLENQTFKNFKIWVVYDQSTDNTLEILKEFEVKLGKSKFQILYSPKRDGLGAARDFALKQKELQGEYIIFPDADDFVEENYLSLLFEKAKSTDSDVTFCGFDRINEFSKKQISRDMIHNNEETITDLLSYQRLIYLNPAAWNKLFKRDLFEDVSFTNIKRSEDLFCWLKMIPKITKISFVNRILYHYRIRAGSLSNDYGFPQFEIVKFGFIEAQKFYSTHPFYDSFCVFLEATAILRLGVGAITRCYGKSKADGRRAKKSFYTFMDDCFHNWRKNSIFSFKSSKKNGFKGLAVWLAVKNLRFHTFPIFVFFYRCFTKATRRDIKW
jgi:glycosyltransferase EpsH